tara:strand:+ start:259 stop:375 length:117 start_codon:yes stop_codon:yes gene_type:complete
MIRRLKGNIVDIRKVGEEGLGGGLIVRRGPEENNFLCL